MATLQETHFPVDNTMGASLVGVICASVLYGVSCVQTWYYFTHYSKDAFYIKCLVTAVWVFDTIHEILISHTGKPSIPSHFPSPDANQRLVYYYVVSNFDNASNLHKLVWSILLEVLFNGLIGLLVQGFLALRVWKLSEGNVPLTVVISLLVLAEFACSAAFTVESLKLRTWEDLASLKGLSISVNIIGVVADVIIAGALFFFLHRSRTGFKKSDTMISRLILFTVSTGFLTSLCAIGSLVSILAWGHTLIYVAFYFSIGRLYSNSLLSTLNVRKSIRGMGEDSDELSFSLPQSLAKSASRPLSSTQRRTNISIKISTMHELPASDIQEPASATTESTF